MEALIFSVKHTQSCVGKVSHIMRMTLMRRKICKTFGMAAAGMWLVSTFAIAQPAPPGQTMTCTKVDLSGYCIEAKSQDDKVTVIRTEGVKVSEEVSCVTSGGTTTCTKVTNDEVRPSSSPAGCPHEATAACGGCRMGTRKAKHERHASIAQSNMAGQPSVSVRLLRVTRWATKGEAAHESRP